MTESKRTRNNQSGEKLLCILEKMAQCAEPMRIQDLSAALDMNPSTLLRFLSTLVKCGYAAQDPDSSKYYLTLKLCNLASNISFNISLRDIARPYLRALSSAFGESVCLAIEQNESVTYIEVVQGPDQMLRTMQRIGSIAPLHCTGVGKLLLLNYTPAQIDSLVEKKGLPVFTSNTIATKKQLLQELEQVRRRGFAYDNEECEIGAKCVAAPLYDYTGQVAGAISVTGPIFRMTSELIKDKLHILLKTAQDISYKLGWEGGTQGGL